MISRKYKLHVLERKPTADFFEPSEILFRQNRSIGSVKTFFFFLNLEILLVSEDELYSLSSSTTSSSTYVFCLYCPGVPFAHI